MPDDEPTAEENHSDRQRKNEKICLSDDHKQMLRNKAVPLLTNPLQDLKILQGFSLLWDRRLGVSAGPLPVTVRAGHGRFLLPTWYRVTVLSTGGHTNP